MAERRPLPPKEYSKTELLPELQQPRFLFWYALLQAYPCSPAFPASSAAAFS